MKILFGIIYFGLLAWTFVLGRKSIFDNWFNDTKTVVKYLDSNGKEITEEEAHERQEFLNQLFGEIETACINYDNTSKEEKIEHWKNIIKEAQEEINNLEQKTNDGQEEK